jgi:hypothetical protein
MSHSRRISFAVCLLAILALGACRRDVDRGADPSPSFGVRVTDVSLGRAIGGDRAITDRTATFGPNDTIYASVTTDGHAESATLRARWTYEDGQVVEESTQTISPRGQEHTEFHISKPDGWPDGSYQVEIYLDGQSVETRDFQVRG